MDRDHPNSDAGSGLFERSFGKLWASAAPHGRVGISAATVVVADAIQWHPWLMHCRRLLCAEEHARIARRRAESHRASLSVAYALHRLLLAQVFGCPAHRVRMSRDARGRPCVPDDAVWTSLSHSGTLLAFAFSRASRVGVDIEPRVRADVACEVANALLHPSEAAELAPLGRDARAAALLALWVRKEAVLKAIGMGLEVEMRSFEAGPLELVHVPGFEHIPLHVHDVDVRLDAMVAVAVACARGQVDVVCLEPSTLRTAMSADREAAT